MSESDHSSASSDLMQALLAIQRVERRFLADLRQTCAGDPRFFDAFRRWQQDLSWLKLHIHRAEEKLLHYLRVPEEHRPWRELPVSISKGSDHVREWQNRIGPYFQSIRLDTRYRRIADPLNLDEEARTADIVTDFVGLAAVCEATFDALACFATHPDDQRYLEDLAFYHVLSPWKQQGLRAMHDVLVWLHAYLCEFDEL